MKVRFWGVRGSLPVPGHKTVRYGGNTSCVEVLSPAGTRVIVDAGTGMRRLGEELAESTPGRPVHVLVSHTHWDHIQGLPFFAPLYHPDHRIEVFARQRDGVAGSLRAALGSQLEAPYFNRPLAQVRADLAFHELLDGARFPLHDLQVTTARLNHPNVATAYALAAEGRKVVYVSDTAPFDTLLFGDAFVARPPAPDYVLPPHERAYLDRMRADVVALCEGADLVVYDTMFTAQDYRQQPHFGHSRPCDALEICRAAGARALALFHHAPERADAEVDAMVAEARALAARTAPGVHVLAAFEGLTLDLSQPLPEALP